MARPADARRWWPRRRAHVHRSLLEEGAKELLAKETLADAELQALLRRVVSSTAEPSVPAEEDILKITTGRRKREAATRDEGLAGNARGAEKVLGE